MTTIVLRKKLTDYLQIADDKKIKAIYTMVEDEINTIANDWDKDFIGELDRRSEGFQNGTAKTYSWKETKSAATKRVRSKRK
jgi:hypothetical protein